MKYYRVKKVVKVYETRREETVYIPQHKSTWWPFWQCYMENSYVIFKRIPVERADEEDAWKVINDVRDKTLLFTH